MRRQRFASAAISLAVEFALFALMLKFLPSIHPKLKNVCPGALIATMAEAYDVAVALHCPLGPIALAACLQLDACTYNAFIQEQSLGIHYNAGNDLLDYVGDPASFRYQDGFVTIPSGPGLGIDVNEELVIERARQGHRWRNPVWRHRDGSVAEW